VSRALAYCAFLDAGEISWPQAGVGGAAVRQMAAGALRLLWSETEWPFRAEDMQKNAVEFHEVVNSIFRHRAVVPFRLLSLFEDAGALGAFLAGHESAFVADLERLRDMVQMECVVYPRPAEAPRQAGSGADYLREKAAKQHMISRQVEQVRAALGALARDIRVRETKSGSRIFVLTERGQENEFRWTAGQVPVPAELAQRVSGPWPAAEFLSDQVRTPKVAG
jgi:hypothetical protein